MPENSSNDQFFSIRSPFLWLVVLAEALGLSVVVLAIVWTKDYMGGYGWTGSPNQFNLHPLCMLVGFVYCMAQAALVYRIGRYLPKMTAKILHVILQILSVVGMSVGLAAVFLTHGGLKLQSIHSWIALLTVATFCLQFILGLWMYLVPFIPGLSALSLPDSLRAGYLPLHKYFGMAMLFTATMACTTGVTEFLEGYYGGESLPVVARIGNSLAFLLVAFVVCVGFIVNKESWKRTEKNDGYQSIGDNENEASPSREGSINPE